MRFSINIIQNENWTYFFFSSFSFFKRKKTTWNRVIYMSSHLKSEHESTYRKSCGDMLHHALRFFYNLPHRIVSNIIVYFKKTATTYKKKVTRKQHKFNFNKYQLVYLKSKLNTYISFIFWIKRKNVLKTNRIESQRYFDMYSGSACYFLFMFNYFKAPLLQR